MKVQWAQVGDIVTRVTDNVEVRSDQSYRNVGIKNRGRGLFEKGSLPGSGTKYTKLNKIRSGQLIYSKLFGWEGAIAVVSGRFDGAYVSSEFPTFDLDPDHVHPAYLRHVVCWEGFTEQLADATSGLGQRRQRVNPDRFVELRVPVPSLTDQHRIATHLDQVLGFAHYELIRRDWTRVFKARLLDKAAVDATHVRLGELLSPVAGSNVDGGKSYQIAGVYSFGRGLLRRPTIRGDETKYQSMTRLTEGLVVYSKLGAFEGAVAVVAPEFEDTWVSPEFQTFDVAGVVSRGYLGHYLTSMRFQEQLASVTAGVGARQKRVSPRVFLEQEIPMPNEEVQGKVERACNRIDQAHRTAERARERRSALVPAARNEVFGAMS